MSHSPATASLPRRWCSFLLGDACFAVAAEIVVEVLRGRPLARVPLAARGVLGLIHLRGRIVPVIDPAVSLAVPREQRTPSGPHLVIELGDDWYGLRVDEMIEVSEIPSDRIERPLTGGEGFFGTFAAETRLVHLLDPERMIHSLVRQSAHHSTRPGGIHGGG